MLSTGWLLRSGVVVHGVRTIIGTWVDSSKGQTLPPRRCSPQRKPLSLMKKITVLRRAPRCLSAFTMVFTCRSTSKSAEIWRPSI